MGRPPTIVREELLASARRIFAAKGFAAATLADIAAELRVTPAAILRHTESKEALFLTAMRGSDQVQPPPCVLDLAAVDAAEADPREVLRSLAGGFIPFAKNMIETRLVMAMHENTRRTSLVLPFDAASEDSPPRRGLRIVVDYFERAAKAGRLHVSNPRAAALLFMGSLQGYVLTQHVLQAGALVPLPVYIDALIELWCDGAITGGKSARRKKMDSPRRRTGRAGRGNRGDADLHASATAAAPTRSVRNPRGEDGERGVTRRRSRHSRVHR